MSRKITSDQHQLVPHLGLIPTDWTPGHVSDCIKGLESGVSVNGESRPAQEGEFGVLKVSSVSYGYFDKNANKVILDGEIHRAKVHPRAKSILISRSNTPDLVGASAYIAHDHSTLFLPDKLWQTIAKDDLQLSSRWLAFYLASDFARYRLSSLATGTSNSMRNITQDELLSLPIPIPKFPEQKAIASVLSTWDSAIETTEQLIAAKEKRKQALMQRLLTGKVRFGEFVGEEWKTVPLGKLFEQVKESIGDKDIPPYSISAGIGFVSQREKWGKDIAGRQYSKYTHLRKGQFAYNKGNSKRYGCGCAYLLKDQNEIAVPNVFVSFKQVRDDVCSEFYEQFFIADYHARELKKYITSGARSDGLLNLNKGDFFKIKVPCPSPDEQKKIAEALRSADNEIQVHRDELEALKAQKKGLMQQLLTGKVRVKVS